MMQRTYVIIFLTLTFCQVAICATPLDRESYEAAIECYLFFGCDCGEDGYESLMDCVLIVKNQTIGWGIQMAFSHEVCEVGTANIESKDFDYLRSLACSKDKQVMNNCVKALSKEGKEYSEGLSTSDNVEDKEELAALGEAYKCVLPLINMCRMLPGECEI